MFLKPLIERAIIALQVVVLALVSLTVSNSPVVAAQSSLTVTGVVSDLNGNGLPTWVVKVTAPGDATTLYGPSFTDANGTYTIHVDPGTYDFHFNQGDSNGIDPVTIANQVISTDTTLNAQVNVVTHAFSGTLKGADGTPLGGAEVALVTHDFSLGATGDVDSGGNFSFRAKAVNNFHLRLYSDDFPLGFSAFSLVQPDDQYIDMTTTDQNYDFVIHTNTVAVTVRDEQGNLVTDGGVSSLPWSGTQEIAPGIFISATAQDTAQTDANGVATFLAMTGAHYGLTFANTSNYGSDNICASTSDNRINGLCMTSPLTITGDTALTLQVQPNPPGPPPAPTNLTGPAVTNLYTQPNMSWNASAGATSYNVYRNGNYYDTTTSTSYTDMNDGVPFNSVGNKDYRVTAVADGLESSPSNTLSVVVDHEPPHIGYVTNPANSYDGWTTVDTTVTFICLSSDNASCTAPVTITQNTAGTDVVGTAVDLAGNISTITALVKLDKTPATTSSVVVSPTTIRKNKPFTVTADGTEDTSIAQQGEFYIDNDPGQGSGIQMPITCQFGCGHFMIQSTVAGLTKGTHNLYVRVRNSAGIWGPTVATTFIFK